MSTTTEAQITLPVSLGEALDKLTILDIKMRKIKDEGRLADVKKEYDVLMTSLKQYVDAFPYHYRILFEVNLAIWEIQDLFHGKDTTPEEGAKLCRNILLENDRRFRVKAKINALSNSALREQKGYGAKKALIYTHLGLGDMFWMNGAVRYLATAYDSVTVVCKKRNRANVAAMYADDPSIKLLVIEDDVDLHPWPRAAEWFKEQGYEIYGCGLFSLGNNTDDKFLYNLPVSFYDDMKLNPAIRTSYFHIPVSDTAKELASFFKDTPYILVHQQSSVETLPIVDHIRQSQPDAFILDINKNHYARDHPLWASAELVVNMPLLDYMVLLEGAQELHLIESSLYCLASHLNLSKVKRKVCYKPWGGNAERLGVFETGKLPAPAAPEPK